MQETRKERNSNIELLRIIAMFFIIMSHCSVHGIGYDIKSDFTINKLALYWFRLGNLGVNIFVIISGYFLVNSLHPRRSLSKFLAQVWFYSVGCLLFYLVYSGGGLSVKSVVKEVIQAVFPTVCEQYWFFTAYIVLLLLSPYINILLNNFSQKQHKGFLIVTGILWCIIPTFTTRKMFGTQIPMFLMLYSIGAYLRKYPENRFSDRKFAVTLTAASFVLLFLSSVVISFLNNYIDFLNGHESVFYSRNSLLIILCAVGLFSSFAYAKPFYNKGINKVAGCVFGIYLIHDNRFIRGLLWKNWLPNFMYINRVYFIPVMLLSVCIVFIVGAIIEFLRKVLIEKWSTGIIDCVIRKGRGLMQKYDL